MTAYGRTRRWSKDDLDEEGRGRLAELALDLGRTVPHLGVADAIGYRLRRNYGYLLAVTLVAWTLKLETQPEAAPTVAAFLERARVGLLPGESVIGGVFLFAVGVVILVLRAPSEQMLGWNEVPAPFLRWNRSGRGRLKGDPGPVVNPEESHGA